MKGTSNSVRWRPGQKENLERIAKATGLEVIDLVRASVDALVSYVDAHGGKLLLPLNFQTGFKTYPIESQHRILHEPPAGKAVLKSKSGR